MQFKEYDTKLFKYQRRVLGVSMRKLADICRCDEKTIMNVENGTCGRETTIIIIGLALDGLAEEQGIRFDGNTIQIS